VILLCLAIFKQVENYEKQDDPELNKLKDIFYNFFNQEKYWTGNLSMLNNRNIMNEINLYKGSKSYTINKQNIYMCLKDENGGYYPQNMLIYVLAHEFAHVLCNSIGHTEEFHNIFDDLMAELIKDGIYDPKEEIILDYCEHGDKS
tara:strand:- start:134 stop:571 length:438 start_codon:yes stop_codon:yes gene_type:complete